MRKVLGVFLGLIVLAVAAVLIGPSFVDWNNYKGQVTRQVQAMTGRELAINGDIRIAVLPAPALVAGDISFANPEGAASPHMATLKSAEVRVALGPLLGGQIKVETVKLIDPVIRLERLADGTANWEFPALAKPAAAPAEAGGGVPAVALDNLSIENGTIIYADAVSGAAERIEALNARIAAASLIGPLETSGSATVRGLPLSFAVNVGEIIHDRTVPITVQAEAAGGRLKAQIGGTLVNLSEAPKFKGSVKLDGDNLSAVIAELAGAGAQPLLAKGFNLAGEVTASPAGAEVEKLELGLGDIRAAGDLSVDLGDKLRVNSRLEIKRIDLDALLATAMPAGQAAPKTDAGKTAPAAPAAPLRFTLPKDLEAAAILSVDALSFRDGVIRDALVNVSLANGLLSVTQASAQFPGGSDLTAAVKLHTPDGVPAFSAEVDSTVNDLRGVLRWLKVDLPDIPADRLRQMSVRSQLSGSAAQIQVSNLDLRFDSSRLTGAATLALRERLGIGANLSLDRLNLDAYLPQQTAAGPAGDPFAALAVLTTFDANIQAHVKTLVHKANPIKDLVADATLFNGNLEIRRLSVGNLAGATANLKGKLNGLGGVPEAEALTFETKIDDPNRLARLAGTEMPAALRKLGEVTAKGRIDGGLLRPSVDATVGAAGAVLGVKGRFSVLPVAPLVDANLSLRHADAVGLARRFGADYDPAGAIGGIDVAADVTASLSEVRVANLRAQLGKLALRGSVGAKLGAKLGAKPTITASLATGPMVLDPFLPSEPKASSSRGGAPSARSSGGASGGAAGSTGEPRFSREPIDLSVLHSFDAEVSLQSPFIAVQRLAIEKADLALTVRDGRLTTQRLSGTLFDGQLTGTIDAVAGPRHQMAVKAKVAGVDVAKSLTAVTGEALANGRMALDLDLAATGRSPDELVRALGGTATVALTDIDVEKAGKGSMMSGLLGLLTSLGRLGGSTANDQAQMTGSFQIASGIARSNDIKLASAYGNGGAAGIIDLPAWTIDMQGQVTLAQNFLTKLLQAKIRETNSSVPFAIAGPLDAPNVKVDTGALLGSSVPIPGADALLNKAPKGVGNIIRGILGGGQAQPPQAQPLPAPPPQSSGGQPAPADQPPPQQQPSQQQPVNPEQLLKKLFKR